MLRPDSSSPGTILEQIGRTPLVRLQHLDQGLARPVWVKCEYLNPGGSIKDRIALAIVERAELEGRVGPGSTFIEATAGNTGLGLALVAAAKGYRVVCVLPEKMSLDKRNCLRLAGVDVIIVPNAPLESSDNFRNVARQLAEKNNWILADQFFNEANIEAHYSGTGPDIWEQSQGFVSAFVCGVGTGGTMTGVSRYLAEKDSSIQRVLADPAGSALVDWVRHGEFRSEAPYKIEGIGSSSPPHNFQMEWVTSVEVIDDETSFNCQNQLIRQEGLFVGGSSGTIVAAALRVASLPSPSGKDGAVVCVLTDSWDRYWSVLQSNG